MEKLQDLVRMLYRSWGPPKPMQRSQSPDLPNYFLHRVFMGEQDLLAIFHTKRCKYQCTFCDLPQQGSSTFISAHQILSQFSHIVGELKHSLGVIQRVTISNDGSVLDQHTFPQDALISIVESTRELPLCRRIVLETRAEFVTEEALRIIQKSNPNARINLLLGFETANDQIRNEVLGKREKIKDFETALNVISLLNAEVTTYVLFKSSYLMDDEQAILDATTTVDYLVEACRSRAIPLSIRLNPMYCAAGSRWTQSANKYPAYMPPRLSDVMRLAEKTRSRGIPVHVGLSTEGLATSSYRDRDDFNPALLKLAIIQNVRS